MNAISLGLYGTAHNYYLDTYLQRFFLENAASLACAGKGDRPVCEDSIVEAILDFLRYPAPPFNPHAIPVAPRYSLAGRDDYLLGRSGAAESFRSMIGEIDFLADADTAIDDAGDMLTDAEQDIVRKSASLFGKRKGPSERSVKHLHDAAFEMSSKENWPLIATIMDIGLGSSIYWREEFPNRPWVKATDWSADDRDFIAAGLPDWVGADVGGAVSGGVKGAFAGGWVGAGIGALAGGLGSSAGTFVKGWLKRKLGKLFGP